MKLIQGQLIIMLAPYIEQEIYANIKGIKEHEIILTVKSVNVLSIDKNILCISVDNNEIFEFYSVVEESYENTIHIRKPLKNGLSNAEKRRFNRMDCEIGFIGRPVIISDVMITRIDQQFNGTIKNISGGGVLIRTGSMLPEYMVFKFKMKLTYFMDCIAIVRRSVKSSEEGYFESGCEFIEMPVEDIKRISLLVFKEQLKARRKELNTTMLKKIKAND